MGTMIRAFTIFFVLSVAAHGAAGNTKEAKMTYKKPSKEELKKKLTDIQYKVTQEDGTERPFQNEYWDNHRAGIYVDIVTGEPLFSSLDKFDSGTGWPSFTKPLVKENVTTKTDKGFFMTRTEVRSKHGDSHLGHVFEDGPKPTGQRFCMNSASLRFVAVDKLKEEGYGEFLGLFEKAGVANEKGMETHKKAVFAGGCFWCMEKPFESIDGVVSVTSGYTGGKVANPTYDQVSEGGTGHKEAVEIVYDPKKVTYEKLLEVFWRQVDPHDAAGQFCDKGDQYKSAIFVANDDERKLAEASKEQLTKSGTLKAPVVTEVLPAAAFYKAEDYHQDYYKRNPIRYKYYRGRCGRDERLMEVWGKMAKH